MGVAKEEVNDMRCGGDLWGIFVNFLMFVFLFFLLVLLSSFVWIIYIYLYFLHDYIYVDYFNERERGDCSYTKTSGARILGSGPCALAGLMSPAL